MALSDNIKGLMECVVKNDLIKAKKYIKVIADNEKSEKNKSFCEMINNNLQKPPLIELPSNLKGILNIEDVSMNFNDKRYYLNDNEKTIFEKISSTVEVNKQLTEMGIRYVNSTLLYGKSGTGKTSFGKFVAHKLNIPFAYLNFAQCIAGYLGETSKNIENAFEYVKRTKCVFMIDEIDAIGRKRSEKSDMGEMKRIVIGLMQAFDKLCNDVIVIGATNRIEAIDEALARRFTTKHEVSELTTNQTLEMIIMILNDLNIQYDESDIKMYSKNHCIQSDISNDITGAIVKMLKNKSKTITLYEVQK